MTAAHQDDGMPADTAAHAPIQVLPDDVHNRELIAQVHPPSWRNPTAPSARYNIVAVGGGAAGLISSIGIAGLGGKSALIERHLLGGDCLNFGCVPSKALLSAGHVAQSARDAARYGVQITGDVNVDFAAVMERLRRLRAGISHHDSAQRFTDAGVDVYLGSGVFTGPDTIEVAGQTLRFARAVIATGGHAFVPPIPGVDTIGALTNESIFSLTELPKRLAVVGGGPIGSEMALAFRRFGSDVTLFDMGPTILGNDDPDAGAIVQAAFVREGIDVVTSSRVSGFEQTADGIVVSFTAGGDGATAKTVTVDQVLIAAGRRPNIKGLGLEVAGVEVNKRGVVVDDKLRTSNKRIYAAGDVAGSYQFTHTADAMARIVIQNGFFFGRKKLSKLVVPWATYTDPEVAHVGVPYKSLKDHPDLEVFTVELKDVDRAILDGKTEGFARFHVNKKGKIVACTIVADNAGDMISEVCLAMTHDIGIGGIANTIHPYPTQAEVIRAGANAYNRTRLTPFVAKLLRKILAWRR